MSNQSIDPADGRLHIAVAPGLLEHDYVPAPVEGETPEDAEARRQLLATFLAAARKA